MLGGWGVTTAIQAVSNVPLFCAAQTPCGENEHVRLVNGVLQCHACRSGFVSAGGDYPAVSVAFRGRTHDVTLEAHVDD